MSWQLRELTRRPGSMTLQSSMCVVVSVRQRTPWWSITGILFVVFFTLSGAAANMRPFHIPTPRELQRAEQALVAAARRDRIDALIAAGGDHCTLEAARELARALVFDGRSAMAFANDYERRCGNDVIVRRWGDASHLVLASLR
jgi:hypothetical protein